MIMNKDLPLNIDIDMWQEVTCTQVATDIDWPGCTVNRCDPLCWGPEATVSLCRRSLFA